MAKSDWLENAVLDAVGNNTALQITTPYLALYSAAPSDSGGGTELTGNGYARQSISFGAASGGTMDNDATVTFTASGGNWLTATHWGILDASSGGNLLYWGSMNPTAQLDDGESLNLTAGNISLTED